MTLNSHCRIFRSQQNFTSVSFQSACASCWHVHLRSWQVRPLKESKLPFNLIFLFLVKLLHRRVRRSLRGASTSKTITATISLRSYTVPLSAAAASLRNLHLQFQTFRPLVATNGLDAKPMAAVTDHDDFTAHDTTRSMIAVDTDVQEDASTLFIPSDEPTDTVGEHDAQAATEPAPTSEPMTSPKRIKAELDAPPKAVTRKRQRVNNQVPPYSDQQEKASSRLAVDQPCFKEVEKLVPMICDMIINVADDLLARGYFDDEIGNIVAKLKNYKFVHKIYKDSKPVGFLGDTAAGKSTLINCLLNLLDVAAENDDGDSGTSVAQELANAELDQSERFKAIVYYHRQRKIDDLITYHFEDVYDHHNLDTTDLDADEQKACEDNNTTALNFFTTVLCDRNEFQSASSCAAYLAKAKSRDDKDMLSGLKGLVQAYMNTLDRQNGATTVEGATMAEVNRKLKRYKGPVKSSTDTTSQASPWPLVNKITTHLNARILSEGAVLMDLPGTSDVDKNRVRNTREYVEDCGTTVIAHPIIRAKTQDSVWANMVDCIRAGKQSSLIFVCTKTDDFNHQRDREIPEKDRIVFENLQSVVNRIDEEIEEIEDRLQEAEDNGDDSYATINGELKSRTKAKAAADAKLKEAKILMRNRSNVETIQNKFRELTRSHQEIPVFCVSNTIYQQHMRGYNMNKPPDLSVEATDIPRLRQYLFEIPAKRKLAALMKLCKNTIRRVLLAIEMQCSKTRLERKQDVECKVVKPFTCFQEQMASVKSQLKHEFERIMQDVVRKLPEQQL